MPSYNSRYANRTVNDESDAPMPMLGNGGTPMPTFVPQASGGGGGPVFDVAPQLAGSRKHVEEATDYFDDDEEELDEKDVLIQQLRNQNRELRQTMLGGGGLGPTGGITREGVVKMITGEETENITITVPTQDFVLAEMRLIREELFEALERHKEEIREELKDLRETAVPILKMLSHLSKE